MLDASSTIPPPRAATKPTNFAAPAILSVGILNPSPAAAKATIKHDIEIFLAIILWELITRLAPFITSLRFSVIPFCGGSCPKSSSKSSSEAPFPWSPKLFPEVRSSPKSSSPWLPKPELSPEPELFPEVRLSSKPSSPWLPNPSSSWFPVPELFPEPRLLFPLKSTFTSIFLSICLFIASPTDFSSTLSIKRLSNLQSTLLALSWSSVKLVFKATFSINLSTTSWIASELISAAAISGAYFWRPISPHWQ